MLSKGLSRIFSNTTVQEHQKEWGKLEVVTDFVFLGSKITVDDDSSHEIRRRLLLGRKVMINLDSSVEKQRLYSADKGLYSPPRGHIWL